MEALEAGTGTSVNTRRAARPGGVAGNPAIVPCSLAAAAEGLSGAGEIGTLCAQARFRYIVNTLGGPASGPKPARQSACYTQRPRRVAHGEKVPGTGGAKLHADNSCAADTGLACGLHCLLSATHAPSMQSRPFAPVVRMTAVPPCRRPPNSYMGWQPANLHTPTLWKTTKLTPPKLKPR